MILFLLLLILAVDPAVTAASAREQNPLGPQSTQATGEKSILMVAVRFPDASPGMSLEMVKRRALAGLSNYVREQSYGLSSIKADFRGYVLLPEPLERYRVSPYNYQVDRRRVRSLIEDTMTAIEKDVDFSRYDALLIIPAVQTSPAKGYGMICYCANPGMLSGVTRRFTPRYETLRSKGGREFRGGIFVAAENAHLGMFAHDYFHTLGGIQDGKRLVPCLYDYDSQSDASAGLPAFEHHATYMGPWDIMSQHMVRQGEPPPGISAFTKIRLGWIKAAQVHMAAPGETSWTFLSPLSKGGDVLAVKIPLRDGTYYLVENRQPIGYDRMLPGAGLLVSLVDPEAPEGFGTVRVQIADGSRSFANATLTPGQPRRQVFADTRNKVAVVPLWVEKDALGVLVTTPDRSQDAVRAAMAIQTLIERASGVPGDATQGLVTEAVAAFKKQDYARSYALAQQGARD